MASREQRKAAIRRAAERVEHGHGFIRATGQATIDAEYERPGLPAQCPGCGAAMVSPDELCTDCVTEREA